MKKNAPIIDLNNYQSQGNIAIDMVANAIIHERKQGLNPDAISLNAPYFAMLNAWVEHSYGKKAAKCDFFLDGVNVTMDEWNRGTILQVIYHSKAEC